MQIPHIASGASPQGFSPYTDVTGVIMAGGRSSRMGRDKARLEVDGSTMFERVATVFQGLFARVLIAGERPDLAGPGLPCIADRYPGSALGGLYTGLAAADTPYIFVAPCDMPFASSELIRLIVDHRAGYDLVVPRTPAGLEPLFAVYGKACLAPMRAMLEVGNYRIYDFYPQMRVRELTEAEMPAGWDRALRNVNTPEDYQRIKEES
jgi:molybdopterin-guanine dinucleotide biosynthesis protein A